MSENKMPVTEASASEETTELNHYEFAFHVLPTVAEGEVAGVFDTLKSHITNTGAAITSEEAPARVDLAYEIVKPVDGKNRKFGSAYFGWIRFTLGADKLADLTEELEGMPEILRSLTIKLTRVEEAEPFFYHEALADDKKVMTIEEREVMTSSSTPADGAVEDAEDKTSEVSETELTDSLEKITQ